MALANKMTLRNLESFSLKVSVIIANFVTCLTYKAHHGILNNFSIIYKKYCTAPPLANLLPSKALEVAIIF
jgi:hypothetical protein